MSENNKWVKVDPAWDSNIQHPSIPIAEWDGLNDTSIAIPVDHTWTPEESEKLIEKEENIFEEERTDYLKRNGKFFRALNRWFKSQ